MKILWNGYLGSNHSWSIVGQHISRSLIKLGHKVHLHTTNGITHFPDDLKPYLVSTMENDYDMQLSYTSMKNFGAYLNHGSKNRFGIWNYETTVLPPGFAKAYLEVDKILPSSYFSKSIFEKGGVPESSMEVIPHGVDLEAYKLAKPYPIKSKKKIKILANIAQPHLRKNINGLLNVYGKAFSKNDDVVLLLKIVDKKPQQLFEVSASEAISNFKFKYKNHAELEVIKEFIPNIESLYKAVDIVMTLSHAECYYLPGAEALAANKLVISSRYGGQLDYLNDDNSILIGGKEILADKNMQYWSSSPYAKCFDPDQEEAVYKLRHTVKNYDELLNKFLPCIQETARNHTWDKVTNKILKLVK